MARGVQTVNIHEAKTQLSRLVDEVAEGKEVLIAKAGKPLAKLSPLREQKRRRTPGFLKGKLSIAADFDAPLPGDVQKILEGET